MDKSTPPPLPSDSPSGVPPPLPPSEPLPQHRPSKRLGIGDGDGAIVANEPPLKRTRRGRVAEVAALGIKIKGKNKEGGFRQPTAAELQALEDGELEDSDDSGVKDTYLVIEKKGRKKQASESSDKIGESSNVTTAANGPSEESATVNNVKELKVTAPLPNNSVAAGNEASEAKNPAEGTTAGDKEEKMEEGTEDAESNGNVNNDEFLERDFEQAIFSHQFAIIDDVDESDNEDEDIEPIGDGDEEYDSDMDEEIEALLEDDFQKRKEELEKEKSKEIECDIKEKRIIVEYDRDPFDILPEGWCQLNHNSGIHVYLHKKTRVCTLSKPYFLGSGSARRHDVPLSAIPCLHYQKCRDEKKLGATKGDNIPDTTVCDEEKSQTKEDDQQSKVEVPSVSENPEKVCDEQMDTEGKDSEKNTEVATGTDPTDKVINSSGSSEEKKSEVDQSTAMILKLQEDLNQLAAMAQGSPSTPSTPSPGTPGDAKSQEDPSQKPGDNEEEMATEDATKEPEQEETKENKGPTENGELEPNTTEQAIAKPDNGTRDEQAKADKDVRITTIEEHKEKNFLNPVQVHDYCKKLFQFKKIYVKRFHSWKARRSYFRQVRGQKPSLPGGTKLLCVTKSGSAANVKTKEEGGGPSRKRDFILNPKGKSDICILHEYAQHAMRVQPKYVFEETGNAEKPYKATITINDIRYGSGCAANKKGAKAIAAFETLKILIPDVLKLKEDAEKREQFQDLSFFDDVKIEDPRVPELTQKAGQPLPFEILNECLKRNYGLGDTNLNMEMNVIKHQKSEFIMQVAKYTAKVICKSKREGKQLASQSILQQMHPHVKSWGSLLRLYAKDIVNIQDKKDEKPTDGEDAEGETIDPSHQLKHKGDEEAMSKPQEEEALKEGEGRSEAGEEPNKFRDNSTQYNADVFTNVSQQTIISMINFVQATLKSKNAPSESGTSVFNKVGNMKLKMIASAATCCSNINEEGKMADDEVAKILAKPLDIICFPSDVIRIPFRMHKVTQTDWYGRQYFHKATQFPDHDYMKKGEYTTITPRGRHTMQQAMGGMNAGGIYYPGMSMMQPQVASMCGYPPMMSGSGMSINIPTPTSRNLVSPVDSVASASSLSIAGNDWPSVSTPSSTFGGIEQAKVALEKAKDMKPLMELKIDTKKNEGIHGDKEKIDELAKVKQEPNVKHEPNAVDEINKGGVPSYADAEMKLNVPVFMPRSVNKPSGKVIEEGITSMASQSANMASQSKVQSNSGGIQDKTSDDNPEIKKEDCLDLVDDTNGGDYMDEISIKKEKNDVNDTKFDNSKKEHGELGANPSPAASDISSVMPSVSQNQNQMMVQQYGNMNMMAGTSSADMTAMMYGQAAAGYQYVTPQGMGMNQNMMVNQQGLVYMPGNYMPQYYYQPGRVYYPGYGYM